MPTVPFGAPPDAPRSVRSGTESPVSVFDGQNDGEDGLRDHTQPLQSGGTGVNDEPGSFDLKPPPPKQQHSNIEDLAVKFFSSDHLDVILRDQRFSRKFTSFLQQYRPSLVPVLNQYLDTQKAIAAVEYANAIAESLRPARRDSGHAAASLDDSFDGQASEAVQELVVEALPSFVTHRLAHMVTDSLVKEITGQGSPLMRDMIPSLAEVYCVTDPSLPDNPIVYASEGNCRVSLDPTSIYADALQNSIEPLNTARTMSLDETAASCRAQRHQMPQSGDWSMRL